MGGTMFPVHTLKNGLVVVVTSGHGYMFSDGTTFKIEPGIVTNYLSALSVDRVFEDIALPNSRVRATRSSQRLSEEALEHLSILQESKDVDIILVPMMLVSALHEMEADGLLSRARFHKVLGYNSTEETKRCPIQVKVVDVDNWAY